MPRFSVLLPTYNRLDLLAYAIETVRRQEAFDDWEVVVSDNCSEDDIAGYVEGLEDERIRYFRTAEFLPVTENWNNAVDQATGDYLIMLGDDDGLVQGALAYLDQVLREHDDPEYVYTAGFQFGYPGVVPGQASGFYQRPYGPLVEERESPYWLDQEARRGLVRRSCGFRLPLVYNMQHSVVARSTAERMRRGGKFFHGPYPDYYATNALLLEAREVLVNPTPLVCVGISPKSFGFYYFNSMEERGNAFLHNDLEPEVARELEGVLLPGSQMNTSWLVAMELAVQHFGAGHGVTVDRSRYRWIQLMTLLWEGRQEELAGALGGLSWGERLRLRFAEAFYRRGLEQAEESGAGGAFEETFYRTWAPYPRYDEWKHDVDAATMLDVFESFDLSDNAFRSRRPGPPPPPPPGLLGAAFQALATWFTSLPLRALESLKHALRVRLHDVEVIQPGYWQETDSHATVRFQRPGWGLFRVGARLRELGSGNPRQSSVITEMDVAEVEPGIFEARATSPVPDGAYFVEIFRQRGEALIHFHGVLCRRPETAWVRRLEDGARRRAERLTARYGARGAPTPNPSAGAPQFSILTTVYDTPVPFLRVLGQQVLGQTYPDFEWLLLDNGCTRPEVRDFLRELAESDDRVELFRVDPNIHIIPGNAYVLARASGEFLVPIDSDDELSPDALATLAATLEETPDADVLYSDEQLIDARGRPLMPLLRRPTFSPVHAYATCPYSHISALRRSLALQADLYSDDYAQGSHDWDSALRLFEQGARFVHVPEVLYGWRIHATSAAAGEDVKPYALHSQALNLHHSLERRGLVDRFVLTTQFSGFHHLRRIPDAGPPLRLVAIVRAPADVARLQRNLKITRYENLDLHVFLSEAVSDHAAVEAAVRDHWRVRPASFHGFMAPEEIPGILADLPPVEYEAVVDCANQVTAPFWIWDAVGTFELDPQVSLVGGAIHDDAGQLLSLGYYRGLGGSLDTPVAARHRDPSLSLFSMVRNDVDSIYTGFAVYRRSLSTAPGLPAAFDGDGITQGLLWCQRLWEAGHRVAFSPGVRCTRTAALAGPEALEGDLEALLTRWDAQCLRQFHPMVPTHAEMFEITGQLDS